MKYSFGNKKLPTDTLIINMSSALECPMIKECKFSHLNTAKCYAYKAERMYPNVRDSRAAQTTYWRTTSNEQKLLDFADLWRKHPKKMPTIKAVRFNEAGDMRDLLDLALLHKLATTYSDIKFYSYSHNEELMRDIKITDLPSNLTINLSYKHDKPGFNTFILDTDYDGSEDVIPCPGNCKICSLCQDSNELNISVEIH